MSTSPEKDTNDALLLLLMIQGHKNKQTRRLCHPGDEYYWSQKDDSTFCICINIWKSKFCFSNCVFFIFTWLVVHYYWDTQQIQFLKIFRQWLQNHTSWCFFLPKTMRTDPIARIQLEIRTRTCTKFKNQNTTRKRTCTRNKFFFFL